MANIYVKPDQINAKSQDLKNCGKNLRVLANDVDDVKNHVDMDSHATKMNFVKSLIVVETKVMEEAVRAENMGKALALIAKEYVKTDKFVADHAGDTLGMILHVFTNNAFHTILNVFGWDDDYYRQKMGYQNYNTEKSQEYLIDHYLSEACQDLLTQPKYSEAAWKKATPEERKKMMNDFLVEINEYMGTNVVTTIDFHSLSKNTTGGYYNGTNSIELNSDYLREQDYDLMMRTVIHEMRHCYQHTATEHPEQFLVSAQTLEKWRQNFPRENYKTVSKDGYAAYVQQPIEWDAKNFAGQKQDVAGYNNPEYRGSW